MARKHKIKGGINWATKFSRNINTKEDMIILSENSLVFITKINKINRTTET